MIGVTREQFNEHRKPVICLATICVVWINYQLSFVIYTIHVHKTPKTKKRVLWIEEKSREKTSHTHTDIMYKNQRTITKKELGTRVMCTLRPRWLSHTLLVRFLSSVAVYFSTLFVWFFIYKFRCQGNKISCITIKCCKARIRIHYCWSVVHSTLDGVFLISFFLYIFCSYSHVKYQREALKRWLFFFFVFFFISYSYFEITKYLWQKSIYFESLYYIIIQ